MASLKKLLSDTMIYGLSSIVGRFLNYLLVPLYTYKIAATTGGYGVVTNVYAYTALLLVILTFGMETTFFYFSSQHTSQRHEVFSTSAWLVGIVSAVFVGLCVAFIHPISATLGYQNHPEYIQMMACVVALDAFQAIFFARLRLEGKAWKFAMLKLGFIVANITLNLFVFLLAPSLAANHPWIMQWFRPDHQVGYIFGINLICTAAVTLGFLPEMRSLRHGISRRLLRPMLSYTWPLLLLGIAGILNQVADKICYRFIVPGAEGEIQLGIYGACVKIAMIMAIITQAFRYAYEPFVFGGGRDPKSKQMQGAVMKYFVIFTLAAFLAVVCYIDVFKYIICQDYWEGLDAVPIVMIAEIFMGIYFNLSFWYKLNGETYWGAVISTIGCGVLLAVNFIFVPRMGYMACAWGGLAGYGTCMLLSYCIGHVRNPISYPLRSIAAYFTLAIALWGATRLMQPLPFGWRIVGGTLLMLVYAAAVAWGERDLVSKIIQKVTHKKI
ncbi:MAG: lipopolysaccharide biosynthesis protein [Bacteroidales bacterium]|nr:lipopolysaccharide biosynthesis protein [Candidatus Colimorpha onthohippi]